MSRKQYETDEITVYEYYDAENRLIRVFMHMDGWHSATYVDHDMHNELIFPYTKHFNHVFEANPNIRNMLMIGGGGFSYAKYIIAHYEDIFMDVVDNDPSSVEVAKQYFFLNELYAQYHLHETMRLQTIIDDGRHYLETVQKKYDAIINDAYYGILPVFSLITKESFMAAKNLLNDNGVLVLNLPGYENLEESEFLLDVIHTLRTVFQYVHLIKAGNLFNPSDYCNYVVFAQDGCEKMTDAIDYDISRAKTYTDDDIEWLEQHYTY